MECFSVKISGFNQGIAEEEALIKQLKNLEAEIESVKSRVDFQVKGRAGVMNSFNNINTEMEGHISVWNSMKNALGNISNKYQFAEKKNSGISSGLLSAGAEIGNLVAGGGAWISENGISFGGGGGGGRLPANGVSFGFGAEIPIAETSVKAGMKVQGNSFGMGIAALGSLGISEWEATFQKGDVSIGLGTESGQIIDDIKYKRKLYEAKQGKEGVKGEYIKEDGKWVGKTETYGTREGTDEKKGTKTKEETDKGKEIGKKILENTRIASQKKDFISATYWTGSFEDENTSGSLTVSDFKIDGKASLTAAGAEIGVGLGYTVLKGDIESRIGDENFGAHVSGDFAVGKVEAKAGMKATVLDEEGNLNLNLGASASAEAIALEANVAAGVNLGGADVSVVGGVTVGIGAHADVGFYDGKFKFDVGASMGIGLSVDLEIDVSKPLEKLGELGKGAADLWNQGKNMFTSWFS